MQLRKPFRVLFCLVLAVLLAGAAAFAGDAPGELSFAATLFNPDDGGTTWSARSEYLIPLAGGPLYAGPSGEIFDGPGFDGGAVGVAGEFHIGKTCGPGFGGAAHKLFGDASDQAAWTYELRALFECGNQHAALKITGRQVWSRAEDGAVTEPDGKRFDAGVVWRF